MNFCVKIGTLYRFFVLYLHSKKNKKENFLKKFICGVDKNGKLLRKRF